MHILSCAYFISFIRHFMFYVALQNYSHFIKIHYTFEWASLVAQLVKNPPVMQIP